MSRCHNPKNGGYRYYGARGTFVCARWRESFLNFFEDMGPRPPGMTLDRIDNSKGYSKENCRWASWSVQNNNKKKVKSALTKDVSLNLSEISRKYKISRSSIHHHMRQRNLNLIDAIEQTKSCAVTDQVKVMLTLSKEEYAALLEITNNTPTALFLRDLLLDQLAMEASA